jgi:hypothetical protein
MSVDMVYYDAVRHDEVRLFRRLGLPDNATLTHFRAKYINRSKVDHTRPMADGWSYEPIAQRWRKDMDERGFTVESFLHRTVDLVAQAQRLGPADADLGDVAKLREIRDQILSMNKIAKH